MRIIFLFTTLLITRFSFAQNPLPVNAGGKIEYTEVIQVDSASAAQLYSSAKLFFAGAFVSSKDVTQLADDAAHSIVIKYVIPVSWKSYGIRQDGYVKPTLTIQMKDGKYKYSITDFVWEYQAGTRGGLYQYPLETQPGFVGKKQWASIQDQTDADIKIFVDKIKKALADRTKSDW